MSTVRLELYGQGCWAVKPFPLGGMIEDSCGCVSIRQRPVGEGWENNQLREELAVSSGAPVLVAREGNRQGGDVVAATIAAVRQRSGGVLWPRMEAVKPTIRGCLNALCIGAGRLPTHSGPSTFTLGFWWSGQSLKPCRTSVGRGG